MRMEEKKRKAVIGLGANLGEREETIRPRPGGPVNALPGTKVLRQAPLYETAPVGYLDQPNFLNTAAEVETSLSPRAFLGACLGIEAALGRVRTFPNAPRVVDVDLLLMEGVSTERRSCVSPSPHEGAGVCAAAAGGALSGRTGFGVRFFRRHTAGGPQRRTSFIIPIQ